MKKFNISVIGFPEGEKRKNRIESILEKLLANIFLKLIKKTSNLGSSMNLKQEKHKANYTKVHQRKAAKHHTHRIKSIRIKSH